MLLGLGAVLGDLDAAGLAAAADQHLRLDHAGVADLVGGGDRLLDGGGGRAGRHGDAVAREELLALVLEKVHEGRATLQSTAFMPLPKEVTFVTFDVYGTLIDSDTGIYEAFSKEAEKDGYTIARDELIALFKETQKEIKGGSYELYAEVLRRTAVQISKQLGWPLEPSRSGFLPDSVKRWPAFKETNTQLERFKKKFEIGLIANVDDKLLGETRRHFKLDFDLVVTAQQVRSYKPDPAHFKECERRIGGKKGWVHVASDYYYDVEPCIKAKVPVVWVNRNKEQLDSSPEEADRRGEDAPRGGQAARRRLSSVRAVGLHPDVVVVTSRFWQTTCTLVRSGEEAFCIDSPVLPDELEILPSIAEQARFRVVGLLVTHADWDHVLGRYAFPDAPLGRRRADRARLQRRAGRARSACCATSTRRTTSSARGRSALPEPQALPVPGRCGIGDAGARAAPAPTATPPTAWRSGSRGRACWCAATTSRRSRSRCCRRAARARPTSRRSTGSSRSSSRPRTSCPATATLLDAVRAAAILREDRAYLAGAAATRRCRSRGGPARRSASTPRT